MTKQVDERRGRFGRRVGVVFAGVVLAGVTAMTGGLASARTVQRGLSGNPPHSVGNASHNATNNQQKNNPL